MSALQKSMSQLESEGLLTKQDLTRVLTAEIKTRYMMKLDLSILFSLLGGKKYLKFNLSAVKCKILFMSLLRHYESHSICWRTEYNTKQKRSVNSKIK